MHRGRFLAGVAAVGAQCALQAPEAAAETAQRIDVHHHYAAPAWEDAARAQDAYSAAWKGWSPQVAISALDRGGVQKAVLSVTTPGTWFGNDAAARRLARDCNEYAATMIAQHRGRFGMFVALPLLDVTGSLEEIAYGLDTLRADGVGLFTSYGGKYLGDPTFDPVFAELDRRRTVVFVHPTGPKCCTSLLPAIPAPVIEFGTDTTRAIRRVRLHHIAPGKPFLSSITNFAPRSTRAGSFAFSSRCASTTVHPRPRYRSATACPIWPAPRTNAVGTLSSHNGAAILHALARSGQGLTSTVLGSRHSLYLESNTKLLPQSTQDIREVVHARVTSTGEHAMKTFRRLTG